MKIRLLAIASLGALAATGGGAWAATQYVTFLNTPPTYPAYTPDPIGFKSVTVDGVLFDADLGKTAQDQSVDAFIVANGQGAAENYPSATPPYQDFLLYGGQPGEALTVSVVSGAKFDLTSVDMSSEFYSSAPGSQGYVAPYVTVSWNGPHAGSERLNLIQGFQSYALNIVDATDVYISTMKGQPTAYWGLDNLGVDILSSVPEPGAWVTMIMGAFAIGGVLRGRRKRGLRAAAA